jgi:CheY-like chemotaxis protein
MPLGTKPDGLAEETTSMSLSAANSDNALVVLVAEDEFFIRYNIATCLRAAGYAVVETASGEEAIALCESDASIDIVFTDISLVGAASGWDVAESFRMARPNMPVMYTSGKSVEPERRVPGSVFVAKPYRCDDVVEACQRVSVSRH